MATGVLALVLGRATRLAQFLSSAEKRYEATIRLGVSTDTWDRTGTVVLPVNHEPELPGEEEIRRHLESLLGDQDQLPPPFSAKKVAGVRAYALARRGRAVATRPARVALHEAGLASVTGPLIEVRITCSAGYYVRALAHELGRRLGCGASLEQLRRVASGSFTLARALPMAAIAENPEAAAAALVPPEELLPGLEVGILTEEGTRRAAHGNDVGPPDFTVLPGALAGPVKLLGPDGRLLAIAWAGRQPGTLHPAVVLK